MAPGNTKTQTTNIEDPWPTPYNWHPPKSWTEPDPEMPATQSVVITPQGQFKAWSHDWETYHVGTTSEGEEEYWRPERSPTGNTAFNQGEILTLEGHTIQAGVIPLFGGHADEDPKLPPEEARRQMSDPKNVRVVARANDTDKGCQLNGFIVPGTTYSEVARMRALGVSGDWRWFPQLASLDYVGPVFVSRQGLPKGVVTASAYLNLHAGAMFHDQPTYTTQKDQTGQIISVTASNVNTIRIAPMPTNLQDQYDTTPRLANGHDTPDPAGAIDGEKQELSNRVDALQNQVEELFDMVLELQTANETIEEIDQQTPDS